MSALVLISYICYNHFGGDYMRKVVKSICPVLSKEVSIDVDYYPVKQELKIGKVIYQKGLSSCNYRNQGLCKEKKCPVYENAPQNI